MIARIQRFNWQIWAGFLLSVVAFFSYPSFFVNYPFTRDFPWANLLLFVIAAALLLVGLRRAFAAGRPPRSKIAGVILATLSVLVIGFFGFTLFIASRWLPASPGAPQIGQKAPDFSLVDTEGKQVTLSDLVSAPINGKSPKGVLLVFYRGYW
jgi:hypothetical protein